jgi:hypothetical protein
MVNASYPQRDLPSFRACAAVEMEKTATLKKAMPDLHDIGKTSTRPERAGFLRGSQFISFN